jgi:hypothetical protein
MAVVITSPRAVLVIIAIKAIPVFLLQAAPIRLGIRARSSHFLSAPVLILSIPRL